MNSFTIQINKNVFFTVIVILFFGIGSVTTMNAQDEEEYYDDEYYYDEDEEEYYDEEDEEYYEDEYEEDEELQIQESPPGIKVGLNVGFPVITGLFFEDMKKGPNLGIVVSTPYGFFLGPFDVGLGVELMTYSFKNKGSGSADYTGIAFLTTLNASLNDIIAEELPIQLEFRAGIGYFGGGLGNTLGGSIDYQLSEIPLLMSFYVRGNATATSGKGGPGGGDEPTGWISLGIVFNYDISTFF